MKKITEILKTVGFPHKSTSKKNKIKKKAKEPFGPKLEDAKKRLDSKNPKGGSS